MSGNMIYTKIYDAPPVDKGEVLRYAGVRGNADTELMAILDKCIEGIEKKLKFKVCYTVFPIENGNDGLDVGFVRTNSKSLKKRLEGCESIILFAATVGIEMDRLIARYSAVSPTMALMYQALGAERIEALCDWFEKDISEELSRNGKKIHPRFSAGYGDLPLEVQRNIFSVLDCPKNLGISLNESLLMTPTKSVTAIIGVEDINKG